MTLVLVCRTLTLPVRGKVVFIAAPQKKKTFGGAVIHLGSLVPSFAQIALSLTTRRDTLLHGLQPLVNLCQKRNILPRANCIIHCSFLESLAS